MIGKRNFFFFRLNSINKKFREKFALTKHSSQFVIKLFFFNYSLLLLHGLSIVKLFSQSHVITRRKVEKETEDNACNTKPCAFYFIHEYDIKKKKKIYGFKTMERKISSVGSCGLKILKMYRKFLLWKKTLLKN